MRYGVGIDLGTSFTSAAVGSPAGVRMVPLSPDIVVPSIAALTPDGSLLTGLAGARATVGPAARAQGFKRRLGDPSRLILGGSSFSPAALMAAQLRDVLSSITATQGAPPNSIVLTCPAIWGPYRREHFAEVPRLAGIVDYNLVTEPEAAAAHYSRERRLGDGEIVAVYDLGGGTLDTTVLRMRAGGMEILGTPEGIEHMGGIDFDDTLLAGIDERLDGAISALNPEDPEAASALTAIRALCTKAKEDLSSEPDVTLTVPLPTGPREVYISRLDFNEMIKPSVQLTTEALRRTIASAGVQPEDVSAVLLAGGSSRIPLVHQMVSQEFGKPIRVTLHPKHTVALGAATITTQAPTQATPSVNHQSLTPPGGTTAPGLAPSSPNTVGGKVITAGRARKRWLTAAASVVIAVIAATTITLVTTASPQTRDAGPMAPVEPVEPAAKTLPLYDGTVTPPWKGLIGSESTGWRGTSLDAGGSKDGPISAKSDDKNGIDVSWQGGGPAQFYLQSPPDGAGPQDLSSYFADDGALIFDINVTKPPAGAVTMEVHCTYPCLSKVTVTSVLDKLQVGHTTTIAIPLRCITESRTVDWDPRRINTPFLVNTKSSFEATFSNVRWAVETPQSPATIPCGQLS